MKTNPTNDRWWYSGKSRVKARDRDEAVEAFVASTSQWNTWE